MTWQSFHQRGDVLRAVVAAADERRDGVLPTDVPGVAETFGDAAALLAALLLRWHTRLAGRLELALAERPTDPEAAVAAAWTATREDLPGVRAVLDRAHATATDPALVRLLDRAAAKERALLAVSVAA